MRANQCTNNRHQRENGAVKPLPAFLSAIPVDSLLEAQVPGMGSILVYRRQSRSRTLDQAYAQANRGTGSS